MPGLIIPGAILLPVAWTAAALTSAGCLGVGVVSSNACAPGEDLVWGFLPLVGPFAVVGSSDAKLGWRVGYAFYGVLQNAGLAMIIVGASVRRDVWELKPSVRRAEQAELLLGPGSLGVRGTF